MIDKAGGSAGDCPTVIGSDAAFKGEMGAQLHILSAKDGAKVAEYELDAVPVFDGISAANGKLFLALRDGTVACYGGT